MEIGDIEIVVDDVRVADGGLAVDGLAVDGLAVDGLAVDGRGGCAGARGQPVEHCRRLPLRKFPQPSEFAVGGRVVGATFVTDTFVTATVVTATFVTDTVVMGSADAWYLFALRSGG